MCFPVSCAGICFGTLQVFSYLNIECGFARLTTRKKHNNESVNTGIMRKRIKLNIKST